MITGAVDLVISGEVQAFLLIESEDGTRVLELPDEVDVVVGTHARLRRRGARVELEAFASRLGTYVNGERVIGTRDLGPGDALALGPIHAIAGISRARYPKRKTIDSIITSTLQPGETTIVAPTRPTPPIGDMRSQLGEIERSTIIAALDAAGGNQTQAARALGMSRRTLIYRMEKYGLKAAPNR